MHRVWLGNRLSVEKRVFADGTAHPVSPDMAAWRIESSVNNLDHQWKTQKETCKLSTEFLFGPRKWRS